MRTLQRDSIMFPSHGVLSEFPTGKPRTSHRRAALLIVVSVSVLLVGLALVIFAPRYKVDQRLCRAEPLPGSATEIFIDQSDRYSADQVALVTSEIRRRAGTLESGNLFSLLTLDADAGHTPVSEVFSRCRPEDGSQANFWWQNLERIARAYRKLFEMPLDAAITGLLAPNDADRSPLLEALHAIAQRPGFEPGIARRELILVSDGLQRSALADFYQTGYRLEDVARRGSIYLSGLDRFAGSCVRFLLVRSEKYARLQDRPELLAFWRAYFLAAGVDCLDIQRL